MLLYCEVKIICKLYHHYKSINFMYSFFCHQLVANYGGFYDNSAKNGKSGKNDGTVHYIEILGTMWEKIQYSDLTV